MSGTVHAADAAPTSVSPDARRIWTRARGPLLALVILLVAGVAIAALRSGDQRGRLDPRSADRYGSRAVAELLADRGVTTRVVTTTEDAVSAAGPDTTLLVASPDLLTARQLSALRAAIADTPARTVLLAPGPASVTSLVPGTHARPPTAIAPRAPACSLPTARRAGDAELGGPRYTTSAPHAEGCYPGDGLPTLLRLPNPARGDTILLGAPDLLYNHRLAEHGNASLALQLLGSKRHLVWYLPTVGDPASTHDEKRGFLDLIPSGWRWALLQLAVAAVLAALWRARRLGPLVPEHLPVTVPAAETTEGHARMYEQARARGRAAATLRSATRARLAPLLGITPTHAHTPEVVLPALAAHLPAAQKAEAALSTLLFGPAPADDKALVRLADDLDDLERSTVSQERHVPREHPDR